LRDRLQFLALMLCAALLFAYFAGDAQDAPVELVVPPEFEKRILELDRMAIETAYSQQVTHLFETWMRDPAGQPERALRGVNQARKAYVESMTAIERRARQ
jgi:hypothetical protein